MNSLFSQINFVVALHMSTQSPTANLVSEVRNHVIADNATHNIAAPEISKNQSESVGEVEEEDFLEAIYANEENVEDDPIYEDESVMLPKFPSSKAASASFLLQFAKNNTRRLWLARIWITTWMSMN